MIIALCIVGYVVLGIITASAVYAWDKEGFDRDDAAGFWLFGTIALWPFVAAAGACWALVKTSRLIGGVPHQRRLKKIHQRNEARLIWEQELHDNAPDSARYAVAAEMLKLHQGAR